MVISELVKRLKELRKEHGDIEVGYYSTLNTFYVIRSAEYVEHRDSLDDDQIEGVVVSYRGET